MSVVDNFQVYVVISVKPGDEGMAEIGSVVGIGLIGIFCDDQVKFGKFCL